MYKISGIIKIIHSEVIISETFKKREFVLNDKSQYPQFITFQLTKENCDLITNFKEGDEIEVCFNLRGKEWISPTGETKYFNTFEAWRISKISSNLDVVNNEKSIIEDKFFEKDDDDIFPF
jgi:hypothetical protein